MSGFPYTDLYTDSYPDCSYIAVRLLCWDNYLTACYLTAFDFRKKIRFLQAFKECSHQSTGTSPPDPGNQPGEGPTNEDTPKRRQIPCSWPMYPASHPSRTQLELQFPSRKKAMSYAFPHFSEPSEYMHRLRRSCHLCSRMQNSTAIY